MHFLAFIKSLIPHEYKDKQIEDFIKQDKAVEEFILFAFKDKDFPGTDDLTALAYYLYPKLNQEQTAAYQKLLLFYLYLKNGNRQPSNSELLQKVDLIITLQNNDPEYKKVNN